MEDKMEDKVLLKITKNMTRRDLLDCAKDLIVMGETGILPEKGIINSKLLEEYMKNTPKETKTKMEGEQIFNYDNIHHKMTCIQPLVKGLTKLVFEDYIKILTKNG
jgi:hypothetical protein